MTPRSAEHFARAEKRILGGVNSPVRAFRNVGGDKFFVARGEGARIWDIDGNEYIDYVGSWGPTILGHAPKVVVEAVRDAATRAIRVVIWQRIKSAPGRSAITNAGRRFPEGSFRGNGIRTISPATGLTMPHPLLVSSNRGRERIRSAPRR